MANKKITDFIAKATAAVADIIPIVDPADNTNKRVTVGGLAAAIAASFAPKAIKPASLDGVWWEEIGRYSMPTAANSFSISDLPARKYLKVIVLAQPSGASTIDFGVRLNNDSGSNYYFRYGDNGATDGTSNGNYFPWTPQPRNAMSRLEFDVVNILNAVKLITGEAINSGTGDSLASHPERREISGKWINTTSRVSGVTIYNAGGGTYAAGTEIIVLGHD